MRLCSIALAASLCPVGWGGSLHAQTAAGTSALSGVVRGVDSMPISGVELRVMGLDVATRTDERGTYLLAALPAGVHELEIRKLGYAIARRTIELRLGDTVPRDIQLERVVSLDSVTVLGERSRYPDFDARRKESLGGTFLDEAEIDRLKLQSSVDLIYAVSGFSIVGNGRSAGIVSTRTLGFRPCPTLILVDNIPVESLNSVPPALLGAVAM